MTKAILITGGAKRIGKELAIFFANQGYNILLHYNTSKDDALVVQKQINEIYPSRCAIISGNLTNKKTCEDMIAQGIKIFPNLSILFNNASIFQDSAFFDTDEKMLDDYIDIHLKAPFWLSQSFARIIGEGCIINIIDNAILKNPNRFFTYNLSKRMLADFTTMSARILAPKIRVNAIAPGSVLPSPEMDQEILNKKSNILPLKKTPSPNDISNAAKLLVDSNYLTGHILFIDGGEHLL